ncbi:MAG: hypothetical protein ACXVQ0_01845 [Actinomycetota bacterium]
MQVSSTNAAQPSLPFTAKLPAGLGAPTQIFATSQDVPSDGRAIAFEFNTSSYGRVLVIERLPDVPAKDYDAANQALVQSNSASSSPSSFLEIDSIRGGEQALVASNPEGTAAGIYWLEGSVEFYVTGDNLTKSDVLAIANGV